MEGSSSRTRRRHRSSQQLIVSATDIRPLTPSARRGLLAAYALGLAVFSLPQQGGRHRRDTPLPVKTSNRRAGSSSLDLSVSCEIDICPSLVRAQHRQSRRDPEGGRKTPLTLRWLPCKNIRSATGKYGRLARPQPVDRHPPRNRNSRHTQMWVIASLAGRLHSLRQARDGTPQSCRSLPAGTANCVAIACDHDTGEINIVPRLVQGRCHGGTCFACSDNNTARPLGRCGRYFVTALRGLAPVDGGGEDFREEVPSG